MNGWKDLKEAPAEQTPAPRSTHSSAHPQGGRLARINEGRRFARSTALGLLFLLGFTLAAVGAVSLGLGRWIVHNFGYITPDAAILNLRGAGGAGGGGSELVFSALFWAVLIPLLALTVIFGGLGLARRATTRGNDQPFWSWRWGGLLGGIVAAVVATGAWSLADSVQLSRYIASRDPSLDLSAYYVEPETTPSPDVPLNLILIYLESIEDAFEDPNLFELNLLEPLAETTSQWDSVPKLREYELGGWTMAGIVSTQCGIPLRAPSSVGADGMEATQQASHLNSWSGQSYLPGATCLGDILDQNGYTSVFLGGADPAFAGKETFLRTHGYQQILGLEHWTTAGETDISERWGLADSRLFDNAKDQLLELREGDKPFNLTLLTLDTHEPAHLSESCEPMTEHPLGSATLCSLSAVADFLSFVEEEGFLEDTAVMVMGDHLKFVAPANAYYDELDPLTDRSIFNRIWDPAGKAVEVEEIDQLSLFATILDLVGLQPTEGRAGLGVSAFYRGVPAGSMRALPREEAALLTTSQSQALFDSLWSAE